MTCQFSSRYWRVCWLPQDRLFQNIALNQNHCLKFTPTVCSLFTQCCSFCCRAVINVRVKTIFIVRSRRCLRKSRTFTWRDIYAIRVLLDQPLWCTGIGQCIYFAGPDGRRQLYQVKTLNLIWLKSMISDATCGQYITRDSVAIFMLSNQTLYYIRKQNKTGVCCFRAHVNRLQIYQD